MNPDNITTLLQSGLTITGIGMGVVFTLLTLMVAVIRGMSWLSRHFDQGSSVAIDDGELLSVIAAAISAHRRRQSGLQ
jgi:sodium pump decarboxylase gamma subunit